MKGREGGSPSCILRAYVEKFQPKDQPRATRGGLQGGERNRLEGVIVRKRKILKATDVVLGCNSVEGCGKGHCEKSKVIAGLNLAFEMQEWGGEYLKYFESHGPNCTDAHSVHGKSLKIGKQW